MKLIRPATERPAAQPGLCRRSGMDRIHQKGSLMTKYSLCLVRRNYAVVWLDDAPQQRRGWAPCPCQHQRRQHNVTLFLHRNTMHRRDWPLQVVRERVNHGDVNGSLATRSARGVTYVP